MSGTEESKGAYRFWPDAALDEVLAARERRAAGQRELSAEYGLPLISFSMNIAGPVKNSPLISLAFFQGLARLKHELGQDVYKRQVLLTDHNIPADQKGDIPDAGLNAFFPQAPAVKLSLAV